MIEYVIIFLISLWLFRFYIFIQPLEGKEKENNNKSLRQRTIIAIYIFNIDVHLYIKIFAKHKKSVKLCSKKIITLKIIDVNNGKIFEFKKMLV